MFENICNIAAVRNTPLFYVILNGASKEQYKHVARQYGASIVHLLRYILFKSDTLYCQHIGLDIAKPLTIDAVELNIIEDLHLADGPDSLDSSTLCVQTLKTMLFSENEIYLAALDVKPTPIFLDW